jgi:outer membrane lipoprotein-sorting protein
LRNASALLLLFLASACGAKRVTLPSGPGTPYPGYAAAVDQATAGCRGVKTMTATLSLSGRAGEQKLRGRVDAGFSAPGAARLEGRAPFGRPVFVLVARDDANAMLVLPRDNRVLRNAPAAAIVEALTGVKLDPDELRSAVAGCGFGGGSPSAGRAYGDDWIAVDAGEVVHYLRRVDGRWRLAASTRGPLTVEYQDFLPDRPATIRMRTAPSSGKPEAQTDLTLKLSDVEINVPLGPEVFKEDVPAGADPLTIEELRRAGPLGDSAR